MNDEKMKEKLLRVTWEYPGGDGYTLNSIRSIVAYPDRVVISFSKTPSLTLSTECLTHIKRLRRLRKMLKNKFYLSISTTGVCDELIVELIEELKKITIIRNGYSKEVL